MDNARIEQQGSHSVGSEMYSNFIIFMVTFILGLMMHLILI